MSLTKLMTSAAQMELIHPATGPTGIFLKVSGRDTAQFRNAYKRIMQERMNESSKKNNVTDLDKLEKDNLELICLCVVGWDDLETFGEYSKERVKELMAMPELTWMREQVEAFIEERANFFQHVAEPTKEGS